MNAKLNSIIYLHKYKLISFELGGSLPSIITTETKLILLNYYM